jgi:hypothetical protein
MTVQLTDTFSTSAGIGMPIARKAGIYTYLCIAFATQFKPHGNTGNRFHAGLAHLYRRVVLPGNFKSP